MSFLEKFLVQLAQKISLSLAGRQVGFNSHALYFINNQRIQKKPH